MEEIKTLGYDWEFGHEELAIAVDRFARGGGLYIGLYKREYDVWEVFGNLTVNLPHEPREVNEAYIDNFCSKNKLEFIERHKLGRQLPDTGHSGFATYAKVAFDLSRLAEFDKEGVKKFCKFHGLSQPNNKAEKKKKTEPER